MTKTNLADNNYYLPNGSSLSSNLAKIEGNILKH